MKPLTRILLFGASEGGCAALRRATRREVVVGFLDNDPVKQGGVFEGLPVYAPSQISNLEFDVVVVASIHWAAIEQQLRELGLPAHRVISPMRRDPFPWDGLVFLLLALAVAGVLARGLVSWLG